MSLGLQETRPLGMSLADFLSFGNEMEENHAVYSRMIRIATEYDSLKETGYYGAAEPRFRFELSH